MSSVLGSWKQISLGEFVTLQRGYDLPEKERTEGQVPVIGSSGLTGWHDKANVKGPGVALGRSGNSFGVATFCPIDYWAHNTVMFVTDFHGNDIKFTYYFLGFFDFDKYNSGGAQPSLNRNFIYPIQITIPSLHEQRKIAQILSTWDQGIDLTSQLIVAKQQRKRGLMQELLKGQQRFAEFEGEEWKLHEFADFAFLSNKKFDPKQQVESIRCVELEHISQETGQIIGETLTEPQQSIKNIFAQGQVLFGKLRPYLRKYAQPRFSGVCSSEIWVFDSHTDLCINDYLFYLVQTEEFIRVASASSGSKMPRSDWELVSETIFALPSIAEQRRIAKVLQACDREIELLEQKLDLLKQQKQSLMQQLLTGRVRVAVDPVDA